MSDPRLDFLLSPKAIRERSRRILELARSGGTHFEVRWDRLEETSDYVLSVIRENYPTLDIPFHSRWRHFNAGGVDRLARLDHLLEGLTHDRLERAAIKLDLAITSVLLDAGSGPSWKYVERDRVRGETVVTRRSEGLAVASFHLFAEGKLSSDQDRPLQADSRGLRTLSAETLAEAFQVSETNPLVGVEGRASLLNRLGDAVETRHEWFRFDGISRPGNLVRSLARDFAGRPVPATELLHRVLVGLGPIWPGRLTLDGVNLGDCWSYPALGAGKEATDNLVPFHKLSQWLTYSLIEPIEEAGLTVSGVNDLTGLAEYRNGGLFLDRGVIRLRDANLATVAHRPDSPLVIEWRALTVCLLDEIGSRVRERLGRSEAEFPLCRVLEGGTWWAGRKAAAELRSDGGPPLKIESDGTVF